MDEKAAKRIPDWLTTDTLRSVLRHAPRHGADAAMAGVARRDAPYADEAAGPPGIYDYEPMHPERIQRLERLRTADRQSSPLRLRAKILRELQRLELVLGMIQTIETERDAIVSAKSKSHQTSAKKIKHLVKLKSIGPEFATVLVGEVFYRTFDNRKQVGSYVGLTPSPFRAARHPATGHQQGRKC
jgi:hypothetical protein